MDLVELSPIPAYVTVWHDDAKDQCVRLRVQWSFPSVPNTPADTRPYEDGASAMQLLTPHSRSSPHPPEEPTWLPFDPTTSPLHTSCSLSNSCHESAEVSAAYQPEERLSHAFDELLLTYIFTITYRPPSGRSMTTTGQPFIQPFQRPSAFLPSDHLCTSAPCVCSFADYGCGLPPLVRDRASSSADR